MREIKFRAWDGEQMIESYGVGISKFFEMCNGEYEDFNSTENLMQYTGLKDKNGKEIYENDYLEGGGINVWLVKLESGKYILQNISTGDIIDCNENNTQRQEVVGNSYENPREHPAMASDL